MDELPMHIKKAAMRYQPIEVDGLILYSILVKEYTDFIIARPALEVMQQSFPVAMMRMPLLSALYAMDYEAVLNGQQATGLFSRALLMLALSLRLGEGLTTEERIKRFEVSVDRENPAKLVRLRFEDKNGNEHHITPAQYGKLRQIIAAQNGVKLESDKANPDIVKAQQDMSNAASTQLDANIDDWLTAVSSLAGVEEEEIDEWPILKFQRRSDAYLRLLNYIVCGIGELSGTTWKGGNPHPHPFFARANGNGVLQEMGGTADGSNPTTPPKNAAAIREIIQQVSH